MINTHTGSSQSLSGRRRPRNTCALKLCDARSSCGTFDVFTSHPSLTSIQIRPFDGLDALSCLIRDGLVLRCRCNTEFLRLVGRCVHVLQILHSSDALCVTDALVTMVSGQISAFSSSSMSADCSQLPLFFGFSTPEAAHHVFTFSWFPERDDSDIVTVWDTMAILVHHCSGVGGSGGRGKSGGQRGRGGGAREGGRVGRTGRGEERRGGGRRGGGGGGGGKRGGEEKEEGGRGGGEGRGRGGGGGEEVRCRSIQCSRTHQPWPHLSSDKSCELCVRSSARRRSSPSLRCPRRSPNGSSSR